MTFKMNPFTGKVEHGQDPLLALASVTNEPTGFLDPTQWTVEYDATAEEITLTPAATDIIAIRGKLFPFSAPLTETHTNVTGTYFFQFKTDGTIEVDTAFDFELPQLAVVNYDSTQTPKGWAIRETHGCTMDHDTHSTLHSSIGTFRLSGGSFVAGSYTVYAPGDADNPTLASITPAVSATEIKDEDLPSTLAALADGGPYNVFGLKWTSTYWDWTTGYQATAPFIHAANVPQYNPASGGDSLVGLTDDDYFCVYCLAVPAAADAVSQTFRYIWVLGQQKYSPTLPNTAQRTVARNNALAEDPYAEGVLILSPLPSQEYVIVRKLVMHYNTSFTNNDYRLRIEGEQQINKSRSGSGSAVVSLPSLFDSNISITTAAAVGGLDPAVESNQKLVNERYAAFGYIAEWATGTVYRSGNIVQRGNKILRCISAHTSNNFYTDLTANRWIMIGDGGIIGAGATSDATPTVLKSYTPEDGFASALEVKISAYGPAGASRVWFLRYFLKRSGATVTLTKIDEAGAEEAGTTTWVGEVIVNSTAIEIQVTGEAGKTITWNATASFSQF